MTIEEKDCFVASFLAMTVNLLKTIMGTIPRSSSHSPFTTEAVHGVGLLLFWPAAIQVLRSGFATHGLQVLLVTADPSGCPFVPAFRWDIPGRSVFQAPMSFPGGSGTSFSLLGAEALCFPEAL